VQTTLLGVAIAIILALVTALVGPLFIDWNNYRSEFETRASRLTGLDFRVIGAIDARLLPTPTVTLQGVEFGRPDEGSKVRARLLRIEFALGAFARGEWRIADARLEGAEFSAGLDDSGRIAWPLPKLGFDLEAVSIARLQVQDARATLADAASDSRLVLENLDFTGELRSLAGPIKGDGSFVIAGQRYPYRIASSRIGGDAGTKLRFTIDPIGQPLSAEADLSISIERGVPRFDGNVQLARAVGRAPAGAGSLIVEPWRVTSRVKGDSTAAAFEQIEFQYGPDDRAIRLRGGADLRLGRQPEFNATLSSPQIDLDRVLALPETMRRRPLAAVKTFAESLLAASRLPIPAALNLSVDSVTLGGATLARLAAEVKADAGGLDIKGLELRGPGMSQLRLSGHLGAAATGVQFAGSAKLEANDPRGLAAWLGERSDEQSASAGPLRFAGRIAVGAETITIEQLKLDVDRMTVAGRLAYTWARDDRPARLEAALTAPEIDFDRIQAVAKAVLGDTAFDWPREGALSLKIARALVAGVEAKQAEVDMRGDANGFEIARLAVADFGGATLAVKGRIDAAPRSPRGALTLDVDARALDGVLMLVEKIAPAASEQLRRSASRLTPLTLRAVLGLDPAAADSTAAKLKIDGRAGTLRVQAEASATGDTVTRGTLAALAAAKLEFSARLDGDDGGALIELAGLDRILMAEKRPARLTLAAKGPLDGDLAVEAQFAAGAANIAGKGTVRVGDGEKEAELSVKLTNANLRAPRPTPAGRPAEPLPASLTARLALREGMLRLTDVTGTVAGASVRGRLALGLQQQPVSIDGDIEVGALDLPAAIGAVIGMPAQGEGTVASGASANASALWPAEPFEQPLPSFSGEVAVKAARVALTPKLSARDVRGTVHFGQAQLSLQDVEGSIAGGRLSGELTLLRRADGLTARTRVRLVDANAAELLPGDGSLSGRLRIDVAAEGSGMSPVALMGSLAGSGSFTLESARLPRLDPAAFDNVVRAVDQGLPIDAIRIRDRMDAALARGSLGITSAEGEITISEGQARLSNSTVRAQRADLGANGSVNLIDRALDARLTLFAAGGAASAEDIRPEVGIMLRGPIDTPKRTIDVAALASWLALRAVEQQSKKLDVLEGRTPAPPAQPAAATPSASDPTAAKVPGAAKPKAAASPASAERLSPLPAPIDIHPAPTPRAPRGQSGAAAPAPSQAQSPPPAPARPRTLFDMLFGN
jgi:uncharacterized protein involved in outer membrane biogenesis